MLVGTNFTWRPIPALGDNYIWAAAAGGKGVIVDPGEAEPARKWLADEGLQLASIVVTHRHDDHVAGIGELLEAWPQAEVAAPRDEYDGPATRRVAPGEAFELAGCGLRLSALATPGHTRGHLSYLGSGFVLCGDALFACGCGRLFEGDASDLLQSMEAFAAMPAETEVCCGHEYTASNVRFALAVEPDNGELRSYAAEVERLRADGKPTVPTTIGHELQVNPFLRYRMDAIRQAAAKHAGGELPDPAAVLGALRSWKDDF